MKGYRMDDVIGVRAAATKGNVSEQTIRNLADRGEIRSQRNPRNGYREINREDALRLRDRE